MQSELIIDKLRELRFIGMQRAFESTFMAGRDQNYTTDEMINYLLDAELDERKTRKIDRIIRQAKFRYRASVEELEYNQERGLDKNQILRFAQCTYLEKHENIIITGATGVGKSYLASALGNQACVYGYKVIYYNMAKLLTKLKMLRADGSYLRELGRIEKADLLILDDFGLQPLDNQNRLALLELIEDRHENRSTMITSQVPVDKWYEIVGDKTVADAILDRIVYSSHRIELKGESMRKKKRKKSEE